MASKFVHFKSVLKKGYLQKVSKCMLTGRDFWHGLHIYCPSILGSPPSPFSVLLNEKNGRSDMKRYARQHTKTPFRESGY